MKIFIALLLVLSILVLLTSCENPYVPGVSMNIHIYGTVTDVADGSPISGAYVTLWWRSVVLLYTQTNGEGFYSLKKSYFDSTPWTENNKVIRVQETGYSNIGEPPYDYPVSNAEIQEINMQLKKIED